MCGQVPRFMRDAGAEGNADVTPDVPFSDIQDSGPDVLDAGVDADGGVSRCDEARSGVNDNYADLSCEAVDIDRADNLILGICGNPSNRIFTCQINDDPMAEASCSDGASFPSQSMIGMEVFNNSPVSLTRLNDDEIFVPYNVEEAGRLGLSFFDPPDYDRVHASTTSQLNVMSGSDTINVNLRNATAAIQVGQRIFLSLANFNPELGKFEMGIILMLPYDMDTRSIGDYDVSLFFTGGRNPTAMAAIDENTIAILNASGPREAIPDVLPPGETRGASIDTVNASNIGSPEIIRTIGIAEEEMAFLPELTLANGGRSAVVASAGDSPTIYLVPLGGERVRSTPMGAVEGHVSSIAVSESRHEMYVTMSGGDVCKFEHIDLDTLDIGACIYVGENPGPSEVSSDGRILYQAVGSVCGTGTSGIVAVDVNEVR